MLDAVEAILSSLPAREPLSCKSLSCVYGADRVAAAYCSLRHELVRVPGIWQHGSTSRRRSFHPALIVGGLGSYDTVKSRERFWVAREDQAAVLEEHGYRHVKAIGLPVVYLQRTDTVRLPGSLLVMPVHSLDETAHSWQFPEYADYIDSIRSRFSCVVICIHPTCRKKGYWWPEFERRGYTLVEGAYGTDSNSLFRLQKLLQSFEFVTTNGYGSHLVYAPLFGAKMSIAGPYAKITEEDLRDAHLYREVPEVLGPTIEAISESCVRCDFPFFFREPQRAEVYQVWAREETGYDCRISPSEMIRLFGWTPFRRNVGLLRRRTKAAVRNRLRTFLIKYPNKLDWLGRLVAEGAWRPPA